MFETPSFWSPDLSSLVTHAYDHILCCLREEWGWKALLQFVLLVPVCVWWEMWHGTVSSWFAVFLEHCSMLHLAAELGEIHCSLLLPGIVPCVLCSGQMMINAFVLAPMSGRTICSVQCLPAAVPWKCCEQTAWSCVVQSNPCLAGLSTASRCPRELSRVDVATLCWRYSAYPVLGTFIWPWWRAFVPHGWCGSGHSRLTSLCHLLVRDTEHCCICLTSSFWYRNAFKQKTLETAEPHFSELLFWGLDLRVLHHGGEQKASVYGLIMAQITSQMHQHE